VDPRVPQQQPPPRRSAISSVVGNLKALIGLVLFLVVLAVIVVPPRVWASLLSLLLGTS